MEILLEGAAIGWGGTGIFGIPLHGYALRADDGTVVWVDPPDPTEHEAAILELGPPAHVLVTFRDHERAVAETVTRFGAKLWIPRGRGGPFANPDFEFGEDSRLPGEMRAIALPACGYGEHAILGTVKGKRFAFTGDCLWSFEGSRFNPLLRFLAFRELPGGLYMKRHYRGGDDAAVTEQISRLADLDLDALLLSHGPPIERNAREHLSEAFRRPARMTSEGAWRGS